MDCMIEDVLGFLEFGDVFLCGSKQKRVSVVKAGANESTCNHFGHVFRYRGTDVAQGADMIMNGLANGIDMVIHG